MTPRGAEELQETIRLSVADRARADALHRATAASLSKRDHLVAERPDWESLRARARQIKLHTLTHLDYYVTQFAAAARRAGARVAWADDAAAAQRIIVDTARAAGVRCVAKAKTMAGEEIQINAALAAAGIDTVETDFGELICQLSGTPPSHVTAPIIDWSLEQVAALLREHGVNGAPAAHGSPADAPLPEPQRDTRAAQLVAAARAHLRGAFFSADMGISGANFAVAESGTLVLVENEGNIRLSTSLPPLHVAIVGVDKLIPRLADLATFLTLLPVSATGQRQSSYVSLIHRPLGELTIVLLDNGRLRLLSDPEQFDLLSCIRCGACQNVCPVYRHVSGHAYGGVYAGPIGAVLHPHLDGPERFGGLPQLSSLCGACSDVCPVAIPLHERLLEWRRRLASGGFTGPTGRAAFRAWAWLMRHPRLYRRMRPSARWLNDALPRLPPGREWARTREWPAVADESFAQWWERHNDGPAD